ncbi:MAG: hypothetical protein ABSA71_09890 [Desulfomonilia bacterium]|jgi:uncharacterized CHY-type Zn-finger protein
MEAGNNVPWRCCFIAFLTVVFFSANMYAEEQDIPKKFFVTPPPFSAGIYPCSMCHKGLPTNTQPRKLQANMNIPLKHMPGGWCFECHNPDNRDKLRLANGTLVSFEESYILCGQCHGTILREWKAGLHGKRTGMWNGDKQYYLCVSCHSPHEPRFKPIKPSPPPVRPMEIK